MENKKNIYINAIILPFMHGSFYMNNAIIVCEHLKIIDIGFEAIFASCRCFYNVIQTHAKSIYIKCIKSIEYENYRRLLYITVHICLNRSCQYVLCPKKGFFTRG